MTQKKETISLLLSQAFLPGGGGLENSVDIFSRLINKNIMPVEIICISRNKNEEEAFDNKYSIPVFRAQSRFFKHFEKLGKHYNTIVAGQQKLTLIGKLSMMMAGILSIFSMYLLLSKRAIKHRKKRIVLHCFSLSTVVMAQIIKRIFFFIEINTIFSNQFIYKSSGFRLVDYIIGHSLNKTDVIISVSKASNNELVSSFGIPSNKLYVCRSWVDLKGASVTSKHSLFNSDSKVIKILSVSRIVPEKGIQTILDLSKFIQNSHQNSFSITVVGDSNHPIKDNLIKASKEYDCLNYVGRVNPPRLWDFYKSADIFLMPVTWGEGFGRAALEAYTFGLPVLSTNKGAIPELLKDFSIYEITNSLAPAELLERIVNLQKKISKKGRASFQKDCSRIIKHKYSEDNFISYIKAYASLE